MPRLLMTPLDRRRAVVVTSLAFLLVTGASVVVSGCGGSGSSTSNAAPPTASVGTPRGAVSNGPKVFTEAAAEHDMTMTSAQMTAAWETRPGYVRQGGPAVREAYAFALQHGSELTWMPCYCGCVGMEHRSNLDCFVRPRSKGEPVTYDDHASFCDVCVETALVTKRMLAAGSSLAQIRAVIDAGFGASGAPGTPTDMPPI